MDMLPLIGVAVALAGAIRWMLRDLRADLGGRIDRLETRMDGHMDRLETRIDALAADLRTVSERVARVEGAVCGPWPGPPDKADAPPS